MNKLLSALIVAAFATVSLSATAADAPQSGAKTESTAKAKHATVKHNAKAMKAKKAAAKDTPKK
jgi:hypothetical protein